MALALPLLPRIPLASYPHFLFTHPCLGARSLQIVHPPIGPSTSTSPVAHHLRPGSASALPAIVVCPLAPLPTQPALTARFIPSTFLRRSDVIWIVIIAFVNDRAACPAITGAVLPPADHMLRRTSDS